MVSSSRLLTLTALLLLASSGCRWIAGYESAGEGGGDVGMGDGPQRVDLAGPGDAISPPDRSSPAGLDCRTLSVHIGEAARAIWRDEDNDALYVTTASGLHELKDQQFQPLSTFGPPWTLDPAPRALASRDGWIVAAGLSSNIPALAAVDTSTGALTMIELTSGAAPLRDVQLTRHAGTIGLMAMVLTGTNVALVDGIDVKTVKQRTLEIPPTLSATTVHLLRDKTDYYAGYVGSSASNASAAEIWYRQPFDGSWQRLDTRSSLGWLAGAVHGGEMLLVGPPGKALHVIPQVGGGGLDFHDETLPSSEKTSPHAVWAAEEGTFYIAAERQLWRYSAATGAERLSLPLQSSDRIVDVTGSSATRKLWVAFSRGEPITGSAVFECTLGVSP